MRGERRFCRIAVVVLEQHRFVGGLLVHEVPLRVGVVPHEEKRTVSGGTFQGNLGEILLWVHSGEVDQGEGIPRGVVIDGAPYICDVLVRPRSRAATRSASALTDQLEPSLEEFLCLLCREVVANALESGFSGLIDVDATLVERLLRRRS